MGCCCSKTCGDNCCVECTQKCAVGSYLWRGRARNVIAVVTSSRKVEKRGSGWVILTNDGHLFYYLDADGATEWYGANVYLEFGSTMSYVFDVPLGLVTKVGYEKMISDDRVTSQSWFHDSKAVEGGESYLALNVTFTNGAVLVLYICMQG
uniref:Uncharacterized protein n=1 Tax=Clytia hemisphaerica TaxID=252671 RepID=A0A7M5XJB4_9CNID